MATILVCPGYGIGSGELRVVAARVTHWHPINYNGNHGTEVYLDTGKAIRVACWPHDLERAIVKDADVVHVPRV